MMRAMLSLVVVLVLGVVTPAPAAEPSVIGARDYVVKTNVRIVVRDGVTLNANIYTPADAKGPLPIVLTLTPYTIDSLHATGKYFATHDFIYAAVDTRGRGGSQGEFYPTTHEAEDGVDVIDWLSRQAFSDGRVVMWGGSYPGRNQWVIAAQTPPALKAIAPVSTGYYGVDRGMRANIGFTQPLQWWDYVSNKASNTNLFRDDDYWLKALAELSRGDIPYKDFAKALGQDNPMWEANAAHPVIDDYWRSATGDGSALSPAQMSGIKLPVLAITGVYDASQVGLRTFLAHRAEGLRGSGQGQALDSQYFIIGPWDHPGTRNPKRVTGGVDFGEASVIDMLDLHCQWYNWILGRGGKPAFLKDHFTYYRAGDNRWLSAPSLTAATTGQRTFYLSSPATTGSSVAERGELIEPLPGRQADDRYIYDPATPARNEGIEGYGLVSVDYLVNAEAVTRLNGEGLIYDTAPLTSALNLTGMPEADLTLRLDVPDTDFRVALYEVRTDGTQIFLTQDQMRARYRKGLESEELVRPGRYERYRFERFDWVSRQIPAGSRLRLVISPLSLSLHQQRNHNSGGVVAEETNAVNRIATVNLKLGNGASRLILPIN